MFCNFGSPYTITAYDIITQTTDSQWGKEPRHTALLRIVTRNMWQFLKSDSILSMDSILKEKQHLAAELVCRLCTWMRTTVTSTPLNRHITLTSRLQPAICPRRWARDSEPSLSPPSQNWPEKRQHVETGESEQGAKVRFRPLKVLVPPTVQCFTSFPGNIKNHCLIRSNLFTCPPSHTTVRSVQAPVLMVQQHFLY